MPTVEERVALLEERMRELPTKADLEEVVRTEMKEALAQTGRLTKYTIVTAATILGSLAVIGTSVKWIITLFGIGIMKQ